MNAKEYLSKAYRLDQRINSKLEQVASLENMAMNCTSAINGMPNNPSKSVSHMADAVCKIIDIKNNLNDDLAKLLKCKINIIEIIQGVNNIEYRLILEKRYLSYQPWEDIAYDLDYSVSWVLKLHRKALRAVDAVLAGRENKNGVV
jgi:DNA-directed RNA polymerase specialized sigma subunit